MKRLLVVFLVAVVVSLAVFVTSLMQSNPAEAVLYNCGTWFNAYFTCEWDCGGQMNTIYETCEQHGSFIECGYCCSGVVGGGGGSCPASGDYCGCWWDVV